MRTVLVISLAFALGSSFAVVQQAPNTDLAVTEVAALGLWSRPTTDPAPSWPDRIFTALGGAALGAGLGYFASQVARGDWDNAPGPNGLNRPVWAAVGGSAGFALGLSFPFSGRAEPAGAYERPSPGRSVLSIVEIWEVT